MIQPKRGVARLPDSWNLEACMQDRGIRFARGLHAALVDKGVDISTSSVSRLVYKRPQQLDLGLLQVLCEVLACTPNDLLLPPKTPR